MIALLLSAILSTSAPCQPGSVTIYEDASYVIVDEPGMVTCISQAEQGAGLTAHITTQAEASVSIRRIAWVWGEPFPESVQQSVRIVRLPTAY
jgi:hypothetical protein